MNAKNKNDYNDSHNLSLDSDEKTPSAHQRPELFRALCDEYVLRRVDQLRALQDLSAMTNAEDETLDSVSPLVDLVHVAYQHREQLKHVRRKLREAGLPDARLAPVWSSSFLYFELSDRDRSGVVPPTRIVAVLEQAKFVIAETDVDLTGLTVRTKSCLFMCVGKSDISEEKEEFDFLCLNLTTGTQTVYTLPDLERLCPYYSETGLLTNDLLLLTTRLETVKWSLPVNPGSEPTMELQEYSISEEMDLDVADFFMSPNGKTVFVHGHIYGDVVQSKLWCHQSGDKPKYAIFPNSYSFYVTEKGLFRIEMNPNRSRLFRCDPQAPDLVLETSGDLEWRDNCLLLSQKAQCQRPHSYVASNDRIRPVPTTVLE
jgi:hypothetical protein